MAEAPLEISRFAKRLIGDIFFASLPTNADVANFRVWDGETLQRKKRS